MNGKYTLKSFIKVFIKRCFVSLTLLEIMELEKTTIEGLFIIKPRVY